MKYTYRRFLSFVLFLILIFMAPIQIYATDTEEPEIPETIEYPDDPDRCPDLASNSAIVIDAKTGQILYEKNPYDQLYPASITKIMTAFLALEQGTLSSTVTMSEDAVWGIERGSAHIALDVGEKITLEQALYGVLLVSANEASWAVAEHISGDLDTFCKLMTDTATGLGCVSTNFVNANGLHDDNHYTCAYDMALITRAALNNDTFREICASRYYNIPPTNKNEEARELWQNNKLLNPNSDYYYEYCTGGKTGFTEQARGTYVAWATKDDVELICVTMNAHTNAGNFTDARALFKYCFNNYTKTSPIKDFEFSESDTLAAEEFLNTYYNGSNAGTLELSVDTDIEILIDTSIKARDLTFEIKYSEVDVENSILGVLAINHGDDNIYTTPITFSGYVNQDNPKELEEAISEGLVEKPAKKLNMFPVIMVFIALILVAVLVARIIYVRHQRVLNDLNRRNNSHRRNR